MNSSAPKISIKKAFLKQQTPTEKNNNMGNDNSNEQSILENWDLILVLHCMRPNGHHL